MKLVYLIVAGGAISAVHFYLYWRSRSTQKESISEYAIVDRHARVIYFLTHLFGDVLFMLFSYQFYIVENDLTMLFFLNLNFAVFDIAQTIVPSRGRSENTHIALAYIAWQSYLMSGFIALLRLDLSGLYGYLAATLFVPIAGLFIYMHFNRDNLYPYQLAIVPMFVIYMILITLGAA